MSLYTVAQAEPNFTFATNLDTSTTEKANKSSITVSSAQYGTVTQNASSLTGNASYDFGSDGRVLHQWGGAYGISNFIHEIVFKKSSIPSTDVVLFASLNQSQLAIEPATGKLMAFVSSGSNNQRIYSLSNLCDGKFHHIVMSYMDGSTGFRLYVDGVLQGSATSIGNLNYSGFVNLGSYCNTSGGNPFAYAQATIDFYSFYNDSVLTNAEVATFVSNHMATFADRTVTTTALTASALSVSPVLILDGGYLATPLTASAASGAHFNSTRDSFTLLDSYMSTLTLEQWYKFNAKKSITNYGTGGNAAYLYGGSSRNDITDGIQGSGALRITGAAEYVNSFGTATATTEFTDDDFSLGFWVKKTTAEYANIFMAYNSDISKYLIVEWIDTGYLKVNARFNGANNAITTTTDYTDGNWHYVAVRKSGTTMQMWVDNVSIGTETVTQSMSDFVATQFGGGAAGPTELMYVSQFYIGTSANITSTQIANIYSYGLPILQASAAMPDPAFSRNDSFNNYVEAKTPKFYFKMDEATGAPVNTGSSTLAVTTQGTNFTQNITSPVYKSYNITNRDTQFVGSWTETAGTFSTNNKQTLVVYAKFASAGINGVAGTAGFGSTAGTGMFLQQQATGTMRLRSTDGTTTEDATSTVNYADNAYHMFVAVKDGSNLVLYVDGVQAAINTSATHTFTDLGQFTIGGVPNTIPSAATRNLTIDEVAVFNTAFTAQEALEIFQAVDLDMAWTASASLPMPAVAAGFGPTIAEPAMTASAFLPNVFVPISPATGTGLFQQPNFAAIKNVNQTANAMTASAQGESPGFDIGENNLVLHMDASASMGDARALIPGFWNANPGIANAEMVMPAFSSTRGGLVNAQQMPAKAAFIVPPAYKLITDDIWYQKLFLQHSVLNGERFRTSNVASETGSSSANAFLKLFDDVTQNLSGANTNKIINNLPLSIVLDDPTNTSTNIVYANATNSFQTATPLPLLEVGSFDDYERKAVRFRNIQFAIGENEYVANNGYSLEFTFKTTKADQVIAQGYQRSFTSYQSATSSIGLIDGKLFATRVTQSVGGGRIFAHPDNIKLVSHPDFLITATGNKSIADGMWHHIIVQYGFDGRVQFWIDGELDIQFFADSKLIRGAAIRPYIIGSNNSNPRWQSDFETSAWSYDAAFFVDSENITEHYTASIKYEPIQAAPATATAAIGQASKAEGNRPRALMLYFWPTAAEQGSARYPGFTSNESSDDLTTLDYFTRPPQEYEGWDVFPVDVTGYWVSDLVKKEAYGVENIGTTNFITTVSPYQNVAAAPTVLFNTRATFRDPITDAAKYIDLLNDIDLSKFDMIMFKNYPNEPAEKDGFSGAEVVDAYFNLRESKIFEDFVKSLRAAVDTGISLMVATAQLALDLKIVDRVEIVPDMDDNIGQGNYSDPFAPTQMFGISGAANLPTPPTYDEPLGWWDTWKNNRTRIVNTYPGITDYPGLIKTDFAFWYNTDEYSWGGPDRQFTKYEHKDYLSVGDEFVISTTGIRGDRNESGYLATPFENVKAGKIITAFANTVRRGLDLIENPYRNYAQSIVVSPGDVLDGRQVGGKIFVNFTEEINKCAEGGQVELTSDYWVNYAYENGAIDLAARDDLLLQDFVTTETPYWSVNGMNLLRQTGTTYELDTDVNRDGVQKKAVKTRKVNKSGGLSFQSVPTGSVFFSSTYSWAYPTAGFEIPSMPTRGFRWLSNREVLEGTVIRPTAMTAIAQLPNAIAIPDKITNVTVQSMVATAVIVETQFSSGTRTMLALPLTANATIVKPGSTIAISPMRATAGMFANSRPDVASEDQVVLYLIHVEPILYIREDIIK